MQVVPAQRMGCLQTGLDRRALRYLNPSPYMFYLDLGISILPALPRNAGGAGIGHVRPIASTRKRGANSEEDQVLEADLLADPRKSPST